MRWDHSENIGRAKTLPHLLVLGVMLLLLPTSANSADFSWKWRDAQKLGYKRVLRTTPMSESLRAQIIAAISQQLDSGLPNSNSPRELRKLALNTPVTFVDLNGDGQKELIAQGPLDNCSPTGNCPFYVFKKVANGFRLIGESFGQTFTLQGQTNGFVDIVISTHDSAWRSYLSLLQFFKDGMYREVASYIADWREGTEDGYRELKEPRLTPGVKPK